MLTQSGRMQVGLLSGKRTRPIISIS